MIANAFMGAAYMGAFVLAPLLLLGVFDFTITQAAGIMLLRTLTLSLSSPLGGRLGWRLGERGAAMVGAATMTVSLVVIAYGAANEWLPALGLGLVMQGLGHGLGLPSLNSAVASSVPDRDLGIASAASRLMAQVGTAFGITALAIVYGGSNTGDAFATAFLAGAGLSGLSALSLGAAACMERGRSRP